MEFGSVVLGVANQFRSNFGGTVPKTKLLKLAYLVELEYQRRFHERLTRQTWTYYLYGPYVSQYDELLNSPMFDTVEERNEYDGERQATFVVPKFDNLSEIERSVRSIIATVVHQHGQKSLAELLEHVYFDTEPMMNVETRGEVLDFETALDSGYYQVRELRLDKKLESQLRHSFREKVEHLRGKRTS